MTGEQLTPATMHENPFLCLMAALVLEQMEEWLETETLKAMTMSWTVEEVTYMTHRAALVMPTVRKAALICIAALFEYSKSETRH